MSAAVTLSFEDLVPADGVQACLAYWIGPCVVEGLSGAGAGGIAQAMSYQYDVEDQADRIGGVFPQDVDWRAYFAPVAPVQLVRAWSPLPTAVEILGAPDWISVEPDVLGTRAAACAWTSGGEARPYATNAPNHDQERFRRLLAATVIRAGDANRGVLIAAKPGWSYQGAHVPGPATRHLMRDAGFVVTDRHP